MTENLQYIVKACEDRWGLEIGENKSKYNSFLERQVANHKYDVTQKGYPNFLRNKLFLFSYLIGESTIIAGYKDENNENNENNIDKTVERRMGWYSPKDQKPGGSIVKEWELKPQEDRKKDLYLLRPAEMGLVSNSRLSPDKRAREMAFRRTDEVLICLYYSFGKFKSKYQILNSNWGKVIDDLGEDDAVLEYYGDTINYGLVGKCISPNPLTCQKSCVRTSSKHLVEPDMITIITSDKEKPIDDAGLKVLCDEGVGPDRYYVLEEDEDDYGNDDEGYGEDDDY